MLLPANDSIVGGYYWEDTDRRQELSMTTRFQEQYWELTVGARWGVLYAITKVSDGEKLKSTPIAVE